MTLAFSWATNANYSSGPDASTPTKVNPASSTNGFVRGVIAAPQHVNYLFAQIADQLVKAIDGAGGGTYTLASPLTFMGADVRIGANLGIQSGGHLNVTGDANILAGAALNVIGTLNVAGTGAVAVSGGVSLDPGASLIAQNTATAEFRSGSLLKVIGTGVAQMSDADRLTINAAAFAFRLCGRVVFVPTGWAPTIDGNWDMTGATGERLLFALPVHPGDTLTAVAFRFSGAGMGNGGHSGTPPGDRPSIALIRKDGDGTVATVGTQADASVGAAYDATHTVTLSLGAGHLVNTTDTYFVRLTAEGPTGGIANRTRVYGVTGTGLARSFRGSNELY